MYDSIFYESIHKNMIFKINLKKSGKQLYDRGCGSRCCGLVFVCFGLGGWGEITY